MFTMWRGNFVLTCLLARLKVVGQAARSRRMGINNEKDITANLQIGPTNLGMVRIFIEGDGFEVPMDFEPEEAEEIADEIKAAAAKARAANSKKSRK